MNELKVKKVKVAIFQNVVFGGADRAIFNLVEYNASDFEWDLYTIDADSTSCGSYEYNRTSLFIDFPGVIASHTSFPDPCIFVPRWLNRLSWRAWFKFSFKLLDLHRYDKLSKQIAKRIDQGGYAAVLVSICKLTQAPLLLKYLKTPTLYFCHEPNRAIYEKPVEKRSRRLHPAEWLYQNRLKRMDEASARAASVILTNSYYSREYIHKAYGVFSQVCYLGVDKDKFRPSGTEDRNHLLFVGPLWPSKGADFAIRSLGLIEKPRRPKLIIVYSRGSEDDRKALQALSEKLEVTVEFRHKVSDEELCRLYQQAKALLYPSVMEPFGLVVLEAYASGTPVVAVKEGGPRETVINGETGYLVDRYERVFAEAIQRILDDPDLAVRMGENGRKWVESFWTWEYASKRLSAILKRFIKDQ